MYRFVFLIISLGVRDLLKPWALYFSIFAGAATLWNPLTAEPSTPNVDRVILLSETFDSPASLQSWLAESTNEGRISVEPDPRDPGNFGLLMDDAVDNAVFSQNKASIQIPIHGYTGIRIHLDAYSFSDEVHQEADGFDGVAITLNAGPKILLKRYGTQWMADNRFEIVLEGQFNELSLKEGATLGIELLQFDNFSAPNDGILYDNVIVSAVPTRRIYVESRFRVSESDNEISLTALLDPVPTRDISLTLVNSGVPAGTDVYPANSTMATLRFPGFDDEELDGDEALDLKVTDGFFESSSFRIIVEDDEIAGLTLNIPGEISERSVSEGELLVLAGRTSDLVVQLRSSNPSVLTVPEQVTVSPASDRVRFNLAPVEDPRVLGDREVTITAFFGSESVEQTTVVTEANSFAPRFEGPSEISERTGVASYRLVMDAVSDSDLTFTVSSTSEDVIVEQPSVSIPAGQSEISIELIVKDDKIAQGDRPFSLSARSSSDETGIFEGEIIDDEILGFAFDLPERIQAEANFPLQIEALNANNSPVSNYDGLADIYLRSPAEGEEELLVEGLSFQNGRTIAALRIPYQANGGRLIIRSRDGVESMSSPILLFIKLEFAANDLIYDPDRKLIYTISGGEANAGYLHSVARLDPAAGEIGDPMFLGSNPKNAVITDDGQFLYVGLWDSYSVRRINLETFTPQETIVLDADSAWSGDAFYPYGLLAIPGRPLDFIAAQDHRDSTYTTTRLYIDGAVQPRSGRDAFELAPAGSPDQFYAFNSTDTGFDFMRLRLVADGYEIAENQGGLFSNFNTRIIGEGDLIFSNTGKVVDGLQMKSIGEITFPSNWQNRNQAAALATDLSRSRVYYAQGNTIAAYDSQNLQLIEQAALPGIGNIRKLIRWGDVGIALLTDAAEIVLLEDKNLTPSGAPTDLAVEITAAPKPVLVGEELRYEVRVENIGEEIAEDVRLVLEINQGQTFKRVDSGEFSSSFNADRATVDIGEMKAGDSHVFSIITTPNESATLVGVVSVLTSTLDADYANNQASEAINVGFQSAPNSVNIVKIPFNDVLYEPVNKRLIASIASSAQAGIANHIALVDAETGFIETAIACPAEPDRLAVSDDGSTVYALNKSRDAAFHVSVKDESIINVVSFNGLFVDDLEILRGTTDTIVVGSGWDGVRVYQDGVLRPNTSGTYNGDLVELLPDPALVFAYNTEHTGFESYKFEIDASGVNILSTKGGLFSGFQIHIESDGYFVYDTTGKAVRADAMTIDGSFSLNVLEGGGAIAVEPERELRRVYFSRGKTIGSFDSESYLGIQTKSFHELPANIESLERWGADGFAARLSNNELAIIRTDLIPKVASPIDLHVSLEDGTIITAPSITVSGRAFSGQGIANVTVNGESVDTTNGFADWTLNLEGLMAGENPIEITASSLENPPAVRTIHLNVFYQPNPDQDQDRLDDNWELEHFGRLDSPQGDAASDQDNDGLTVLAEFLFGTNPKLADSIEISINSMETADQNSTFQLSFVRRLNKDFETVVWLSEDLRSWAPVNSSEIRLDSESPAPDKPGYVKRVYHMAPKIEPRGFFTPIGQYFRIGFQEPNAPF